MSSLGRPSQYLWLLRRLADKGELVDAAGEPITNKKGEVDVYTALCLLDFVPKNRRFKPPGLTSTEWDKELKIEKKARASLLKLMKNIGGPTRKMSTLPRRVSQSMSRARLDRPSCS